jgi:hypothetical protein
MSEENVEIVRRAFPESGLSPRGSRKPPARDCLPPTPSSTSLLSTSMAFVSSFSVGRR